MEGKKKGIDAQRFHEYSVINFSDWNKVSNNLELDYYGNLFSNIKSAEPLLAISSDSIFGYLN